MSKDTFQVMLLAAALSLLGAGLFLYKSAVLGFPARPDAHGESRIIEAKLSFDAQGGPVTLAMALPRGNRHISVTDIHYVAPGYGRRTDDNGMNRAVTFQKREADGARAVYYRARVFPLDVSMRSAGAEPAPESDFLKKDRKKLLRSDAPPFVEILDEYISEALRKSADKRGLAFALAAKLIEDGRDLSEAMAVSGPREFTDAADRLAFTLNAAGIPARSVTGIDIEKDRRRAPVLRFTEAFFDGDWHSIDPEKGVSAAAGHIVPLAYDTDTLFAVKGAANEDFTLSVGKAMESRATQALWRSAEEAPLIGALSLLNLPLDAQLVFKVLLLVPIGALVITVFRQLLGVPTFGTFMPVLIALAFRETQLLNGILLFILIVGLGLMLRGYFSRLHLLLVPRLAGMLTIVTLLITAIALAGNNFMVSPGFSIALFPLVIMTMTIESMSLIWDEYGPRDAFARAGGSLLAASAGYLCMTNAYAEHLCFVFPELLLIVLAVTVLLGRYNGYTLAEYRRFRALERMQRLHPAEDKEGAA